MSICFLIQEFLKTFLSNFIKEDYFISLKYLLISDYFCSEDDRSKIGLFQ